MSAENIVFEQPVNELMRACMRLEHLFHQAIQHMTSTSVWGSRTALNAMTDILSILDRPDLKTKLTKELCRHLASFGRLEQTPHVDRQKLSHVLIELENVIDKLQATNGKFAQDLRDNEFLSSIRQHLLNPGGACSFDIPAYHLWLQRPPAERTVNLKSWFSQFIVIQTAINLLLRLTRGSSIPQPKTAQEGFYQTTLDAQLSCQLIQVILSADTDLFPEISVGRHGIFIRFHTLSVQGRPMQTSQDVHFKLSTCIL